jgi:hypothetical protein
MEHAHTHTHTHTHTCTHTHTHTHTPDCQMEHVGRPEHQQQAWESTEGGVVVVVDTVEGRERGRTFLR